MKLKQLGHQQTEVEIGGKTVLFSYQTPVAYVDEDGVVYVTTTKWSRTTSKNMNKWVGSLGVNNGYKEVDQTVLDDLFDSIDTMYALYLNGAKIPGSETGKRQSLEKRAYHLQLVMNQNKVFFRVEVRELKSFGG